MLILCFEVLRVVYYYHIGVTHFLFHEYLYFVFTSHAGSRSASISSHGGQGGGEQHGEQHGEQWGGNGEGSRRGGVGGGVGASLYDSPLHSKGRALPGDGGDGVSLRLDCRKRGGAQSFLGFAGAAGVKVLASSMRGGVKPINPDCSTIRTLKRSRSKAGRKQVNGYAMLERIGQGSFSKVRS